MQVRRSTSPTFAKAVADRIRASELAKVLENHVLKDQPMSKTQIQAALGLLKKVVPDLQGIKHEGNMTMENHLTIKE